MRNVALSEAKDHLSEIIAAAEDGEEFVVTRHGRPAAKISPLTDRDATQARARDALERLRKLRGRLRAEGKTATIEEMIAWKNEGRP